MSSVQPAMNARISQSVNHFAPQSSLTCPRVDFFNLLPFSPAQDGGLDCSRVNECALMPVTQLVETVALPSFQGAKSSMTWEKFTEGLSKQSDEASLMRFVQSHKKNVSLRNDIKIEIILGKFSPDLHLSNRTVQFLIKTLSPEIIYFDFHRMIKKYGENLIPPIMDKFVDLYKPYNPVTDYAILEYLFKVSKNKGLLQFWNKHNKYLMREETLETAFRECSPLSLDLLKWLHEQGVPSKWFNVPQEGLTALQKFARRGDIELINAIAKDIPKDQILTSDGTFTFEEEIRDCFIGGPQADLSRFDPNKTIFAQNGCRAVVMTDDGEVYSYPGQEASKLAQQMANGKDLDSFTIYHNPGHASIAFSDAHLGFYPTDNLREMGVGEAFAEGFAQNPALQVAHYGIMSGATLGMQPGSSSFRDSYKSKTAAQFPLQLSASKNLPAAFKSSPCTVIDDSIHKVISDMTNGLTLTVYAPKEKVEAVRQYATKIQEACKSGNATAPFNMLTNNCIDFVRQAVQASGTKADFRNSFHTMQYLRRPGLANGYTLIRSNQPMIQSNASLFDATSLPEAVDRVSRNTLLGAIFSVPGIAYTYLVYKGIPKAKASAFRAGSRIQRVAIAIAGYAAAIGSIFQARVLRRNG